MARLRVCTPKISSNLVNFGDNGVTVVSVEVSRVGARHAGAEILAKLGLEKAIHYYLEAFSVVRLLGMLQLG